MRRGSTMKFGRTGLALKAVLVGLAIVLATAVYVVVAGTTGFCPTCSSIMNFVLGRNDTASTGYLPDDVDAEGAKAHWSGLPQVEELVFTGLDGEPVPVSQYIGRPIVMEVWATWCSKCQKSRSVLSGISDEINELGTVIAVSVDADGSDVVKEYIANEFDGPSPFVEVMATDPKMRKALARHDRRPTIPKLVFINAKGKIDGIHYGLPKPKKVLARLRRLGGEAMKGHVNPHG